MFLVKLGAPVFVPRPRAPDWESGGVATTFLGSDLPRYANEVILTMTSVTIETAYARTD